MVAPAFRYIGGKAKSASWIVQQIPSHTTWVEVFGGAASVTLAKPLSKVEIYNDCAQDLVNFFLALRDHREALIEKIISTPYSRQLYKTWLPAFKTELPVDPIERAAQWYFLQRASFAGKFGAGFAASRSRNEASAFANSVDGLQGLSNRFRQVVIEQFDWAKCIDMYDGADSLLYIDPPYLGCDEENKYMSAGIDHRALSERLHRVQGKVLMSHSAHPVIGELYHDFHRVERSIMTDADGRVRSAKGAPRTKRTEWLLMNFAPERML